MAYRSYRRDLDIAARDLAAFFKMQLIVSSAALVALCGIAYWTFFS
jgi:hypothetical protein